MCACVFIGFDKPVYVFGARLPSKEAQKMSWRKYLSSFLRWSRAVKPDTGAKMKPWVAVGYHTDTKYLEFQAVMRSSTLPVHPLTWLLSPAFCLGWSYGDASWQMLPRMCPKALLGVGKSVPGNFWRAAPKGSCSQVLAQLSLPSPWHLTFCQHW